MIFYDILGIDSNFLEGKSFEFSLGIVNELTILKSLGCNFASLGCEVFRTGDKMFLNSSNN